MVSRLVEDQLIDVLFLQESMGDGKILAGEMETLLQGWVFVWVDSKGKSGGLLLGWKYRYFNLLSAWAMVSGLCVSLYSIELHEDICFVNIYGPYVERESFWNNFLSMECLNSSKLVLGGDLNFFVGFSEI